MTFLRKVLTAAAVLCAALRTEARAEAPAGADRSEEHTSELQSQR